MESNLVKALARSKAVHCFLNLRRLFAEYMSDVNAVCWLELVVAFLLTFATASFLAVAAFLCGWLFIVFTHCDCGGGEVKVQRWKLWLVEQGWLHVRFYFSTISADLVDLVK